MFFGILTLITGLALSTVAAWFAIEGIMAIFAGLPIYAMIMGIVVEIGKVVGITWVYRNWTEKTKLKYIMIPVVVTGLLLTSMGIFGLLSKAHLEQTAPVSNNTSKIERLDQRIIRERTEIADAESIILQLDETIQVLVDYKKISHPTDGARAVRIKQQQQRDQLKSIIDESLNSIDTFEDRKLTLNQELNDLELEVGPVKYIAAIIYEESDSRLDEAVRVVIIAFIFVFDPMAILLLMAGNYTLMGRIGTKPKVVLEHNESSESEESLTKSELRKDAQDIDDEIDDITFDEPIPSIVSIKQLESELEPELPELEPNPKISELNTQNSEVSPDRTTEEIRKALMELQNRVLTPAEIAQKEMLEEMLRRKEVTQKVRNPDKE